MSYVSTDMRPIDFSVCQYGRSSFLLRGRKIHTHEPFWVCLGGAKTYAETVVTPFATQLERRFGVPVINMGIGQSGPDAFWGDPDLMDLINRADLVIAEPPSVMHQSNRFYQVHPRRNDRFIRPSEDLVTLFPEVDFTDCHFTKHLLCKLSLCDPKRFQRVKDDILATRQEKMNVLLNHAKTSFLWYLPNEVSITQITDLYGANMTSLVGVADKIVKVSLSSTHSAFPRNIGQREHDFIAELLSSEIVEILGDLPLEIRLDASYPQPH